MREAADFESRRVEPVSQHLQQDDRKVPDEAPDEQRLPEAIRDTDNLPRSRTCALEQPRRL